MSGLFTFPAVAMRFFSKVRVEESGCWVWTASTDVHGYGQFWVGTKVRLAHRVSFEFLCGAIPQGLTLDHVCRVKTCVNPHHLEPVSRAENVRRHYATVTHCVYGHALSGENLYKKRDGRGRECRTCRVARARERYARKLVSQ